MRIDGMSMSSINIDKQSNLKEGSTVRAEVIDLSGDTAMIDIKGHGLVEAHVDVDMKELIGETILFLIKSLEDGQIVLKPILDEEVLGEFNSKEENITNILKNLNIKDSELSREVIEILMDNDMPINGKVVMETLKNIDKLLDLSNLEETDDVIILNKNIGKETLESSNNQSILKDSKSIEVNKSFENILDMELESDINVKLEMESDIKFNDNISKNENIDLNKNPETYNINRDIDPKDIELDINKSVENENLSKEEMLEKEILNTDIKKILINKNSESGLNVELKDIISEALKDNSLGDRDNIKKIFTFFMKNDIKPSINNIKNFNEFTENPTKYMKGLIGERDNILELLNRKEEIKTKDFTIDALKEEINRLKKESGISPKLREEIKNLDNKLEFIKEMNKDLSFIFLPIHTEQEKYKGIISLLKESNDKSKGKNKSSVFIDLNTYNLGNVKISCQAVANNISIRLQINEEDYDLFKTTEEDLRDRIIAIGYKVDRLDIIYEKDFHVIDDMINNSDSNYFLDIRV